MGGIGSGTWTSRPTVGQCLTVSMSILMKGRDVGPMWCGSISWRDRDGPSGAVDYHCTLDGGMGCLRLAWRVAEAWRNQIVEMVATPQPFGGVRWWFRCPRTGARVLRLHRLRNGSSFASRKALGLSYRSQRRSPSDRCFDRAMAARLALGGDIGRGLMAPFPDKPRGMRWARYNAMRQRAEADEAERGAAMVNQFVRLFGYLPAG